MRSSRSALLTAPVAVVALLSVTVAAQQRPASPPAELIVTNARIYTMDESRPVVEALAVRGGRILFAGSGGEAMALRGPATRVLDLDGRTVVPGMVDAHAHLLGLGEMLRNVDLVGTRSYDEVVARTAARAKTLPAGAWVLGRGWDQNQWGDTRFPTHDALSRAIPDHPVVLGRIDGHAVLANAAAMRAAGITTATRDPEGGRIVRDAQGNPTGVFVDNAEALVTRAMPDLSREEKRTAIRTAITEMHRWGLVGMHDAGAGAEVLGIYEELGKAGQLDLRLYAMIADDSAAIARAFAPRPRLGHDGLLSIRTEIVWLSRFGHEQL